MLQHGIPELPERICVQTILVDRETARIQNFNTTTLSIEPTQGNINEAAEIVENFPNLTPMTIPRDIVPPLQVLQKYKHAEMMTDGPNPTRDRIVQTTNENRKTIGIQCDMAEELNMREFNEAFESKQDDDATNEVDENKFLDFVKEHTKQYENGKIECLLCGEIKPTPKLATLHIAIHWGPPRLCMRCGIKFEHKIPYKNHQCTAKPSARKQLIKCPHYACCVNAVSPAELYDHLNEHCGLRPYCCQNCRNGFPTFSELQLHCKLHQKCSKGLKSNLYKLPMENTRYQKRAMITQIAQGKKVLLKRYLSQVCKQKNKKLRQCSVCLLRCKNLFHYEQHTKRCLAAYKRRLRKKQSSIPQAATPITNGENGV